MNIFSRQPSSIRPAVLVSLLLTPPFGIQLAHAHEYTALIKAKKYAEVALAISTKLATDADYANALLAKVALFERVSRGSTNTAQCA